MRILQVTPRYFPNVGGVEVVVKRISEMLVERGFFVTVCSLDFDGKTAREQCINGVVVKRFKPLVGDPLYLPPPSFIKALKKEDANVIHVHNAHTLVPTFVALSKRRRQKLLLQPHYHKFGQTSTRNLLFNLYKYSLDKLVFPRTELVIANSLYEKKAICDDFPNCRNLVLIEEGIALEELKHVKWTPEKPTRILYVGALRKYKNVEKLLEAFTCILKKKKRPFKLVIVGDGPERERLMNLARKSGIKDHVEWKHDLSRQQLLDEYTRARVFVSLSQLESFSIVIHEAILIGVPTVALNSGVTADMVEEGLVEGVNSLDPKIVANAILKAAERNSLQVDAFRKTCSSWNEYIEKVLGIYRKIS